MYNFSEVVLLVKTAYYYDIVEWINYYKKLGFNHITIYDNESSVDLMSLCNNYGEYITYKKIIGWPDQLQLEYNHYKNSKYEWIFFADSDEFLWIDPKYKDVNDFIAKKTKDIDCNALAIYWIKMSGNPCLYKRDDSPDSTQLKMFHYKQKIENESWMKCFYKTNCNFISMHCHFALPYDKLYDINGNQRYIKDVKINNYNYSKDDGIIYHYYHKSWDEFHKKMTSQYAPEKITYKEVYPDCQFKSYYNYLRLLYKIGYNTYDNKAELFLYKN